MVDGRRRPRDGKTLAPSRDQAYSLLHHLLLVLAVEHYRKRPAITLRPAESTQEP